VVLPPGLTHHDSKARSTGLSPADVIRGLAPPDPRGAWPVS